MFKDDSVIVAIHQPAYLPWLGYLARIAACDAFVFLDTVQFEKNSFTNRNRIKTANGPQWLTVPVLGHGHTTKPMNELAIDNRQDWRKKHLRSVEQNYSRAPWFKQNFSRLAKLYSEPTDRLADLCFSQLQFWLAEFEITTPVVRASSLPVTGQKSGLVLALCEHLGASRYLSGPMGRDYLELGEFARRGIAVDFDEFVHPAYPQLYGDFVPALSVVDYWMNCGREAAFTAFPKRFLAV